MTNDLDMDVQAEKETANRKQGMPKYWYMDLLLVLVILVGGYFRYTGIRWDENQHLHPDERFLTMVENDIQPVKSLAEYFDTANSTLNPHNRGHGFYVYGTLPIFVVRYLAEWTGQTGYDAVNVLGRQVSALFDLITVILVYLIGSRLYDKRVGLLAATFQSLAVMHIQLSHYFAVDTFLATFTTLGIYIAVEIYRSTVDNRGKTEQTASRREALFSHPENMGKFLLFGVALGCAMASKVSAVPLAILLPVAVIPWFVKLTDDERRYWIVSLLRNLVLAALAAFLIFRVFQPYAFSGPGFFNVIPNEKWVNNLKELSGLTSGAADFPPALQWARRPATFALENMVRWGMGIPLGVLAWAGFLVIAWRMVKKDWQQHILVWLWTALYFGWQSQTWNPSMRYMILVYPVLFIMGAWLVFFALDRVKEKTYGRIFTRGILALTCLVIVATGIWAFAFTRIYNRPVTRIEASRWIYQNIPGPVNLHIQTGDGMYNQPLPFPDTMTVSEQNPAVFSFTANSTGMINEVFVYRLVDQMKAVGEKQFSIQLADGNGQSSLAEVNSTFYASGDPCGDSYLFMLDRPFQVKQGGTYQVTLAASAGPAVFSLQGSAIANESDWDDGLPLRIDNYDGFGGIYRGNYNFQMYWDENEEKRQRFLDNLDGADVIMITSNRQWATTVRIPERYPLATAYYRNLIGCPEDKDILWCYSVAQPGMFQGRLGYNLAEVFQSDPSLGSIRLNDQFAEEAFTVYDHPKVLIFRKSADYDTLEVHNIFNSIDLSRVIHVPLNEVPMDSPRDLLLSAATWQVQQAGGTWTDLFNPAGILNRFPGVSVVAWYLFIAALGWLVFPLTWLAFPGLKDRGYAFSRLAGLLLFALISWLAGSAGIPVTRWTLAGVLGIILLLNLLILNKWKQEIRLFISSHSKQILITELVFFVFFGLDLLIRIGNPDLWHPYKGGEKPMDFSYLNAVIKSTLYPPYDPWFAGGYINYYYYGYVISGLPVKLLGIMPSIAYNLILPTLFALLATGMFSIVWNIAARHPHYKSTGYEEDSTEAVNLGWKPYVIGFAGAVLFVVLGNLGTVRMIWQGFQKIAAPGGDILAGGIFKQIAWAFQGLVSLFKGGSLPYSLGDWYWIPSRAIPAPNDVEPITEFPFFTFLYADLHAHMMALPITVMVLGWVVSMVLSSGRFDPGSRLQQLVQWLAILFTGALAVGALRPTNTWDFPVYLVLALLAVIYAAYLGRKPVTNRDTLPILRNPWVSGAISLVVLATLSFLLYQPFADWYGAAYTSVELWKGTHTPTGSYLTHWGVFLFFIVSWMVAETIDWMAVTPLRSLAKLRPYAGFIGLMGLLVILLSVLLVLMGAGIAWFVLPLAAWALVLILRQDQPHMKRVVLFLTGTGLVLTLFVEVVVLKGDIGRMNTVFKFYLQVWTLFSMSAAAAGWWTFLRIRSGRMRWASAYKAIGALLLVGAFLFTLTAGLAKIKDRYVNSASQSLDGVNYMTGATYGENGTEMQLAEDLAGIRWLLSNVTGSPVIVEGHVTEYRWGSRYTINTGLPGVVGWNWHQRQQRAVTPPEWVTDRVAQVGEFYSTTSIPAAVEFLREYNIKYIILGQLEKAIYPAEGLQKFHLETGVPWRVVYRQDNTIILEVNLE